MSFWLLLPLAMPVSFLLTWVLRRYALARSLIDVPNARSSHTVATPRGGGVAIVFSFLLGLLLAAVFGIVPWALGCALMGAGAGIAFLGFWDDHGHIPALWRLLGHVAGAGWVVFSLGGVPPITLYGVTISQGWVTYVLTMAYLVWVLNLYNFMDGIDGIASVEAISICLGGALLYGLLGQWMLAGPLLLLACAVAGFLCWNFPPARIFMGDAGSGFLGIVLATFSLQAGWVASELFWSWVILLGVFVTDATLTLLRRLLRGERVYEAHRSHAYQFASRKFGRHLPVTLAVAAINLVWLLPIALLVGTRNLDVVIGMFVAYGPLVGLAIKFDSGAAEVRVA